MSNRGKGTADAEQDLLQLAQRDPHQVISATESVDPSASDAVVRLRARSIALRIVDRNGDALRAITEAARIAADRTDDEQLASCRLSEAPLLAHVGRPDAAHVALDEVEQIRADQPLALAEVHFQRAGVLLLMANWRGAHDLYSRALSVFRAHDSLAWIADCQLARGLMAAYLGDIAAAEHDFDDAIGHFTDLGDTIGVGQTMWNRALATSLVGEPARAVIDFDAAGQLLAEAGFPVDLFLGDQVNALLAVGLHEEAIELAERCVAAYAASHDGQAPTTANVLDEASRRLELARVHALTGDPLRAEHHSRLAGDAFVEHGQARRARFAELVALECRSLRGEAPGPTSTRARELDAELTADPQPEWRCLPVLIQARCALHLGDPDTAMRLVNLARRRNRTFLDELTRLELGARSRAAQERPDQVLRWIRRAVTTVARSPRLTGTMWVQAALTRKLDDLADVGFSTLLRAGDGRGALDLLALIQKATRDAARAPQPSPSLVAEHAALTRSIEEASNAGRDTTLLRERQIDSARRIRVAATRLRPAASNPSTSKETTPDRFARWFVAHGQLYLVVHDRSARPRHTTTCLGEAESVVRAVDDVNYLVRRALRMPTARRVAAVREAAAALETRLGFDRILPDQHSRRHTPMHLQFPGQLAGLVPGLMPSIPGTPWVVVERIGESVAAPEGLRSIGLVGGPDLEHADRELRAVAGEHRVEFAPHRPHTADEALRAFAEADLVHLCAHSLLNIGNPMFSSIRFADRELTLHELEAAPIQPRCVIAASCESARATGVGMTQIGISHAFLASGVDLVVGTALPIPDTPATIEVMASLHRSVNDHGPVRALSQLPRTRFDPIEELIADCLVPHARQPLRV